MTSKLNIIIGPMKAGKSDTIIRIKNKYNSIGKKVCIVNHSYDTIRTQKENIIMTHDKNTIDSINTYNLFNIINNESYIISDIVMIDESQFFTDLVEFITDQLEISNKHFYVFGLSGDCKQKKIGKILDLIPIADDITFLKSYCGLCLDTTAAPFTMKVNSDSKSMENLHISFDDYIPVCRKHLK